MTSTDDAATVLEMFCQDVANLPAEIAHLMEEIQAKDTQISQCRDAITSRDNAIQKHVRTAGSHIKHPKEDAFTKTIMASFDKIEILQAEKLGLSEKAMIILDRQIKRFDVKLRDLQVSDQFPHDPTLPSLLQTSSSNTAAPLSGVSTPLNPLSVNTAQGGGAPNIANAAIAARLGASTTSRSHSPLTAQNPILTQSHLSGAPARNARENSADATKRRRLNTSMSSTLPAQSSSLRQSSIGPASTPKAGTPVPSSRAGSAQPSRPMAIKKAPGNKKVAPHHAANAAAVAVPSGGRKRVRSSILASKQGDRRRQLVRERGRGSPSASPTPSDSRASTSPTPSSMPHGHDGTTDSRAGRHRHKDADAAGASDEEGEEADVDAEGEEDDTQVYCTCQRVSFGDMVACDNDDCKYQWFHWGCVGLKEEPKGEWLCPYCRQLPKEQIVRGK